MAISVMGIEAGILTNTLYDIIKYVGAKLFHQWETKDEKLQDLIKETLIENCPDDLCNIFESSTFVSYFNCPQFLDAINVFLEHKIVCNYTKESIRVQSYLNKDGAITARDVANYISSNIYDLYIKNGVVTVPGQPTIQRAIEYIISVAEKIVAQNLSPETSQMIYFINSRADVLHKQIIDILNKQRDILDQIQAKQLSPNYESFEEIRAKYYAILKEKNSVAHIYLLDKFPFEQFYVPPVLQNVSDDLIDKNINVYSFVQLTRRLSSWKDIFVKNNIIYLIGGAGYGKSLFTKKIINDYTELNLFHSNDYIVIYGELKSFYKNGPDSALTVVEFLRESIRSSTLMDVPIDFIQHYLNSGRCIILLDALDEVDKSKRNSLHESVVAFFKNQNPNNMICITSRDRGFIPERNVEVVRICQLNEDQIEKYVDKIIALGKFEKEDKEAFMKQTGVLIQKGFLNSFLVLSLLINIYKAERELPENKLDLYQKCFEYIANKRERDKTQKEFDWKLISPIMKDNTFIELSRMGLPNNSNVDKIDIKDHLLEIYKTKYACEADAENAIDEFLRFCSDRTELFVPTAEDKFKFFHRSFFEYFYSYYIFLRCGSENEMLEELMKFDVDSEVFELTVAMLKQKAELKYQSLLELMFEKAAAELSNGSNDFTVLNSLILAMQVVDDALYRNRFLDLIVNNKSVFLSKEYIHNLKLIPVIYENDDASCKKICEAYEDECLMSLFSAFDRVFQLDEMYSKEHEKSLFDQIFDNDPFPISFRYRVYVNLKIESDFYLTIFSKTWDCKEVLFEASDETILRIYDNFSHRNYKKRAAYTRASIERFRSFSEEMQERIMQLIFSSYFDLIS